MSYKNHWMRDVEAIIRKERQDLIGEFNAIRDRIILQMKERYGNTAKGNEYLENLFKEEFKKWE